MNGTEKQIIWAENLLNKMHTELAEAVNIAPEAQRAQVAALFSAIEKIMQEAYAGDVIELLKDNANTGYDYYKCFYTFLNISGNAAAMQIKKEIFKKI